MNRHPLDRNRGSVLPMVLVLTVVGSIIVVALLNFAVALFRTQPKLAARDDAFMSARSAMEMAIVFQRAAGPDQCFTTTQPATFPINGSTASASCSPAGNYYGTARNQFGLITTSADASTALTGPASAQIAGSVFVSGLDLTDTRQWFDLVGDDSEGDGTHDYPTLPPVPAAPRGSIDPPRYGSCSLYFPGRYSDPLTLSAGDHYFTSGVYYFGDVVTLEPGARAVAGLGPVGGCTGGDAIAAGSNSAPTTSGISGFGATFLFGGDGRLVVDNARLHMNRRVSDASTRGTDGVSIRSINFGQAATPAAPGIPGLPAIPSDVVFIASTYSAANTSCDASLSTERCLQAVADHSPGGSIAYSTSALVPDPLTPVVWIDQQASTAAANGVTIDGMILTPNASIVLTGGTNADHQLRISGGLVADSVVLDHQSPSGDYLIGMVDQAIQRRFDLVVSVTAPNGGAATSRAVLDVNADGNYAINAWSVDASQ